VDCVLVVALVGGARSAHCELLGGGLVLKGRFQELDKSAGKSHENTVKFAVFILIGKVVNEKHEILRQYFNIPFQMHSSLRWALLCLCCVLD
jgi:hypothetical protein